MLCLIFLLLIKFVLRDKLCGRVYHCIYFLYVSFGHGWSLRNMLLFA